MAASWNIWFPPYFHFRFRHKWMSDDLPGIHFSKWECQTVILENIKYSAGRLPTERAIQSTWVVF